MSLEEIIGHSPDEADALVLANFAMKFPYREVEVKSLVGNLVELSNSGGDQLPPMHPKEYHNLDV